MDYYMTIQSKLDLPNLYIGLLKQLSAKFYAHPKIQLSGKAWRQEAPFIEELHPKNKGSEWEWELDFSSTKDRLIDILNYLCESSCRLSIDAAYSLAISRRYVCITLLFWGRNSHPGGVLPINQVSLSIDDAIVRNLDDEDQISVADQISDAEELFFKVCELDVLNAQLSHECVFVNPIQAKMIFHRHIREFVKDFCLLYGSYNYGREASEMLSTLSFEDHLWCQPTQHSTNPRFQENKNKGGILPYISKDLDRDLDRDLDFLNHLEETHVRCLLSLSDSRIREILWQVSDMVPAIRCHDFGENGFALTTDPRLYLWPAYKRFAELALSL